MLCVKQPAEPASPLWQVRAGLKAIYCSGWQVAGDANSAGDVYPDQSLYPANSVPEVVRKINRVRITFMSVGPLSRHAAVSGRSTCWPQVLPGPARCRRQCWWLSSFLAGSRRYNHILKHFCNLSTGHVCRCSV